MVNHFRPLTEASLRADLRELAERARKLREELKDSLRAVRESSIGFSRPHSTPKRYQRRRPQAGISKQENASP